MMQAALISPSVLALGKYHDSTIISSFASIIHNRMCIYLDEENFILEQYKEIALSCETAKVLLKLLQANGDTKFIKLNSDIFPLDLPKTELTLLKKVMSEKNLITDSEIRYISHQTDITAHGISIFDFPRFPSMFNRKLNLTYESFTPLLFETLKNMVQSKTGKKIENLHNDVLTSNLKAHGYNNNFTISDQSRAGESASGGVGSLDLYVLERNTNPFSVIECLCESSFGKDNKTVIDHFNKLINDYDKVGFCRNYLITYCEASNFKNAFDSYTKLIKSANKSTHFTSKYKVNNVNELNTDVANIKLLVSSHEREGRNVQVYHYFADFSQSDKAKASLEKVKKVVTARFQNPLNPDQKYSGRGRQPKWYSEHIKINGNDDALRIVP